MSSAPSRKLAVVAAVLSLVLLGVSPCSPNYAASRNCTDLSLSVTAGGPGVLLPSCPPFTDAMEVTFQEQITFTSVPSDLRAVIVPTRRSDTIQISAIPSAVPGTELLRIHTEPRGRGLHQFAHDYAVTVTILPSGVVRYRIGGTVNGLAGSLMLQDNGADDLMVNQDGAFVFPTLLPSGAAYSATVSVPPPGQSCTVSNGNGTVAAADVTSIALTCVNTVQHYTIGGTVQGLTGTGLVLVLSADSVDHPLTLDASAASFTFPTELADGTSYEVIVSQQPTGQTCTVDQGGSGTVNGAAVTDVLVSCASSPPPPPPDFTVSAMANPLVTPTGGTTTLSAVASGGIGPFLYAWRGYRDDGSAFSYTLSSVCAAQPTAALIFPGSDFYFFVTVTDCGNHAITNPGSCAAACPGGPTHDAYVRVHEADDAVAQFTVSPSSIHAGVDAITFDASASSGVVTPIGWTLQFLGDVPEPSGIEGYLRLQADSQGTLFWETVLFTTTDLMTLTVPGASFSQRGAYRMLLQVNGDVSTHQTYEYFFVQP